MQSQRWFAGGLGGSNKPDSWISLLFSESNTQLTSHTILPSGLILVGGKTAIGSYYNGLLATYSPAGTLENQKVLSSSTNTSEILGLASNDSGNIFSCAAVNASSSGTHRQTAIMALSDDMAISWVKWDGRPVTGGVDLPPVTCVCGDTNRVFCLLDYQDYVTSYRSDGTGYRSLHVSASNHSLHPADICTITGVQSPIVYTCGSSYTADIGYVAYVEKIDTANSPYVLWGRYYYYGTTQINVYSSCMATESGVYVVGRQERSSLPSLAVLARYTPSGNVNINKTLTDGSNYCRFQSCCISPDGYIYAIGQASYGSGVNFTPVIVKYDLSGNLIFQWDIRADKATYVTASSIMPDLSLVLSGYSFASRANYSDASGFICRLSLEILDRAQTNPVIFGPFTLSRSNLTSGTLSTSSNSLSSSLVGGQQSYTQPSLKFDPSGLSTVTYPAS